MTIVGCYTCATFHRLALAASRAKDMAELISLQRDYQEHLDNEHRYEPSHVAPRRELYLDLWPNAIIAGG